MTDDETTTTKRAGLSPIEVGAGAGAAVITAFASSYLGTAGTLTGAAIASVVGTVSTSVLRNSARTSADRLKQTTTKLRETRVQQAGVADVRPVESEDIDPYGTQLFGASDWIDPEAPARSNRPGLIGPAGAEPGSAWDSSTRGLGAAPDAGSPAGTPFRPGAGPIPRGTGPSGGAAGPWTGPTVSWPATGPDTGGSRRPGAGESGRPGSTGPGTGGAWTGADRPRDGSTGASSGTGGPGTGATRPADRGIAPWEASAEAGVGGSWTGGTRPGVGAAGPWAAPARAGIGTGGPGTGGTKPVTRLNEPVVAGTGTGDPEGLAGVLQAMKRVKGRWVVLGVGAVAAFTLALGAITGIEAIAGKPLSGLAGHESGGGTTIGRATGGDRGGTTPSPTPTPTTGGTTPTAPATDGAPSPSPTEPSGPPAGNPAPPPTQGPTEAPTQAPTQAPNPQQTP